VNDGQNDLNTWTYFEFEYFGGKDYGYIRKRDGVQALFFINGELMVSYNAEASCTPAEEDELNRIGFLLTGGKDFKNRVINPYSLVPRCLNGMRIRNRRYQN
jgi:hypothetical protein